MASAGSGFTAEDHAWMARALRLAARGLWTTQPNPRVGCVIVQDGRAVGEGWHQRAGEPHAETFALRAAGLRTPGATAYVTLEPCSHHGRTPPCADALIAAGIARVVVAAEDTNPKVAGAGLARLRAAGITVETGLMRSASRDLNRGFFSRFERLRPWVRVKLAMSLDGRTALANGESKWITGAAARVDVQRWRARSSAILTGAGTARVDDPRLTVRLPLASPGDPVHAQTPTVRNTGPSPAPAGHALPPGEGNRLAVPLRVVLDSRLDALSESAHLLDGSVPTLVLHGPGASSHDDRYGRVELAEVPLLADGARLDLDAVLRLLAARGVNELQVEAGPALGGALIDAGLVDELLLYAAPVLFGGDARPLLQVAPSMRVADAREWRIIDRRMVGADTRLLLRPTGLRT